MNLAGLNMIGVSWAKMRATHAPPPPPTYLSYRCIRCDVLGYSGEPPHDCWVCGLADCVVAR